MENGSKPFALEGGAQTVEEEQQGRHWTRMAVIMTRCELGLRLMTLGLTLVAAVVVGVNKETKVLSLTVAPTLPTLHLPVTAKWQYMSSSVYFVVANSIACFYAVMSFVHGIITTKNLGSNAALTTSILDIAMVALLYSANGASIATGLIARNGNSYVHWKKVCHLFVGYCNQMTVAFALSMLGSAMFLWIVVFNTIKLHKNQSC